MDLLKPPELGTESVLPRQLLAVFFALPLLLLVFPADWTALFSKSSHPDFKAQIPVVGPAGAPSSGLRVVGSWASQGDQLVPDHKGDRAPALEIGVPPGFWDEAEIGLVGDADALWTIKLTNRFEDEESSSTMPITSRSFIKVDPRVGLNLDAQQLADPAFMDSPLVLVLVPPSDGRPAIRQVNVRFTSNASNPLPPLADVVAIGLLPLLLGLAFRLALGWSPGRCVAMGLGGAAAAAFGLHRMTAAPPGGGVALAASVAAFGFLQAILRTHGMAGRRGKSLMFPPEEVTRAAYGLALAAVLLLSMLARWNAFAEARRSELSPDALGYVQIALSDKGFYETAQAHAPWVREPLFPALLGFWFDFAPDTTSSAILFSGMLSLVMLAMVFFVSARLFNVWVAIVAAGAVGLTPEWAQMGVRVLREDLTICLLMGLMACRLWLGDNPRARAGVFGVLGMALVLTRISALAFVVPVIAWEAWRTKWRWHEVAIAVLMVVLPLLPHLHFNYSFRDSHDPFYSSNVHTRFFLNREFAGQPGMPSAAEVAADPYAGAAVSTVKYFFKFHTIPQVITGHIAGYWRLFVWGSPREYVFHGQEWLMLPGLLGAWVLIRNRKEWWVAAWFVLAVFPFAFIASRGASWRLGSEATILSAWVWALGVAQAGSWLVDQWRSRRPGRAIPSE